MVRRNTGFDSDGEAPVSTPADLIPWLESYLFLSGEQS